MTEPGPVTVVGAGIAGLACARALTGRRPRRPGARPRPPAGRADVLAHVHGRAGRPRRLLPDRAATARRSPPWWPTGSHRGLARPWTDTFAVAGPDGLRETEDRAGPLRRAGRAALAWSRTWRPASTVSSGRTRASRSAPGRPSTASPSRPSSWRCPGRRRARLLDPDERGRARLAAAESVAPGRRGRPRLGRGGGGRPTCTAPSCTTPRCVDWIADDGDRRGDGAPVLVAHTTAELAARHLDDPDAAVPGGGGGRARGAGHRRRPGVDRRAPLDLRPARPSRARSRSGWSTASACAATAGTPRRRSRAPGPPGPPSAPPSPAA